MSKIDASKINLGNSFVLNSDGKAMVNKEITDAKIIADSIIAEAQKKAEAFIQEAKQKADKIIMQAEEQAEATKDDVLAESKKLGYEEGYENGKEKITTEMEDLVYNLNNFAKCKFEMKNRIIKSVHNDILDLVLSISQQVCKEEITHDRQKLLNLVTNAIGQLKEKENVTIIVNPEMARKIYEISNDMKEKILSLENIKIVEDNAVSPDGTIVESVGSRVDARVSAQIERFAQHLYDELNSTPEIELARELDDTEDDDKFTEI